MRKLQPHEAYLHRDVRLRALSDAPDSFGQTFADAEAQPISYWEELTRSVTDSDRQVMLLACQGEDVLGSAYGLLDREHAEAGRVGGMWVEPAWRRRGVGHAMLQELFKWARERGLKRLGLWAPADNRAAISLYSGAGFRTTGERQKLATNSSLWIVAMEAEV